MYQFSHLFAAIRFTAARLRHECAVQRQLEPFGEPEHGIRPVRRSRGLLLALARQNGAGARLFAAVPHRMVRTCRRKSFPIRWPGSQFPKAAKFRRAAVFCADASLPPDLHKQIGQEVVASCLEFGLAPRRRNDRWRRAPSLLQITCLVGDRLGGGRPGDKSSVEGHGMAIGQRAHSF